MADIEALKSDLEGLRLVEHPGLVKQGSRDFYWYSPILKRQLKDVTADILVYPKSEEEVIRVLKTCYARDIPVTARGSGTGNYGQAMPLAGGVVLVLRDMEAIKEIAPGRLVVEAGAKLEDIDRVCRERSGQELRMHPSTHRTASIGGFIAGGSGGIGSISWGGLRDLGNVIRIRLITMEAEPRVIELTGSDIHKANHAYGTNGIITEVEVPLAPAYDWIGMVVGLNSFAEAAAYGNALARQDAILKKLVTPIAAPVPQQYFPSLQGCVPDGMSICLVMIAPQALGAFKAFNAGIGGEVLYRSDDPDAPADIPPMFELSWNHTTLQALKVDKTITYLQVLYPFPNQLELVARMHEHFGDEVPGHLEFVRFDGDITCFGLPLVRYTTDARLEEIMRFHEENGCPIFNPHRYTLEEGGMKQTDAVQLAFKREADPKGLLNPGKMVAWEDPDFDFSTQKTYLFPGLAG